MRSKKVSTAFGVLALLIALVVVYELSPDRRSRRLAERSLPEIRSLLVRDGRLAHLEAYLAGGKTGWGVSIKGDVPSEQDLTDVKVFVKKVCPDVRVDWSLSVKATPATK